MDRPADLEPAVAKMRSLEAVGTQTRLGDGVRQVLTELRGAPPSAIVLLTDGQTTEGESLSKAAELAARKGVPLYTIGLGSPEPARDLELTELLVDDVVFVDDAVRFQAKLSARGFQGQKVVVRLKERGRLGRPQGGTRARDQGGRRARDGQPERVELVHRPKKTGERTFIIEVEPRPRELQTDNNRIERVITVRKEKLKVLYLDSEPRYEFRYLKNYLERDESIDLNVVLLSSDTEYSEQDRSALPTFPASKDDLFAYDVVIIGDADTSFLSQSQMQNLVQFVTEKGGGVLFVAGRALQPAELPEDTARAAPADRAGRRAQPDGRGHQRRLLPARADASRGGPTRSSASAIMKWTACRSGSNCPSSTGTSRPRARSPRPRCSPSTRR